jgi:hypothetical protein
MKTLFQLGFRPADFILGQTASLPDVSRAEELCREAVAAQMDADDPRYEGDRQERIEARERAVDELVAEMRRIKQEAEASGLRPVIDFVECRITFQSSGGRVMAGSSRLGQISPFATIASAAISAAGTVAASYIEKEAQEEIAESREKIARAQIEAERQKAEEERKRAEAEALKTGALPGGPVVQETMVLGIPLTYVLIGGGVLLLGTLLLATRK